MPTWDERLTPAEIKILALYVNSLGTREAMTERWRRTRAMAAWLSLGCWSGGRAALLAGANAHLVYVACPVPARMRRPPEGRRATRRRVPGGEIRLLKERRTMREDR